VIWTRRPSTPVPFYLYRKRDVSGVSGTGVVAVGVVLPSGKAVLEWCSRWPTVTLFHSVDQILRIHGHGGATEVRWGPIPDPALEVPPVLTAAPASPRPSRTAPLGLARIQLFHREDDRRPLRRRWWSRRPVELDAAAWSRRLMPWRRRRQG
jgi:hypothetical protein